MGDCGEGQAEDAVFGVAESFEELADAGQVGSFGGVDVYEGRHYQLDHSLEASLSRGVLCICPERQVIQSALLEVYLDSLKLPTIDVLQLAMARLRLLRVLSQHAKRVLVVLVDTHHLSCEEEEESEEVGLVQALDLVVDCLF